MLFRSKLQTCFHLLLPLIAFGVRHSVSSLFAGLGKLLLMLTVATVLLFLAAHSAQIIRLVLARLQSICFLTVEAPHALCPPQSKTPSRILLRTPRLPLRFQLPPPVSF
jgi:hypothetical protein